MPNGCPVQNSHWLSAGRSEITHATDSRRGGRQSRFSNKSHLDRIREQRDAPLVQGPHEVRLGVDCSTLAIAPFSSVGTGAVPRSRLERIFGVTTFELG